MDTTNQAVHSAEDVFRRENEDSASGRSKSHKATSWFVPPLVIPAFLIGLIVARVAYVAYS